MNLTVWQIISTVFYSLCGSGGIVLFFLNRWAKKKDSKDDRIIEGIKLVLENDAVIFKALREHQINGESEDQEEKMNNYFRNIFIN